MNTMSTLLKFSTLHIHNGSEIGGTTISKTSAIYLSNLFVLNKQMGKEDIRVTYFRLKDMEKKRNESFKEIKDSMEKFSWHLN